MPPPGPVPSRWAFGYRNMAASRAADILHDDLRLLLRLDPASSAAAGRAGASRGARPSYSTPEHAIVVQTAPSPAPPLDARHRISSTRTYQPRRRRLVTTRCARWLLRHPDVPVRRRRRWQALVDGDVPRTRREGRDGWPVRAPPVRQRRLAPRRAAGAGKKTALSRRRPPRCRRRRCVVVATEWWCRPSRAVRLLRACRRSQGCVASRTGDQWGQWPRSL